MNKKISFILCMICVAAIILVSGCNSGKAKNKLTLEQIKQSYVKTGEKALNTQEYKNYVLVESQVSANGNRFILYDLKTGDKDILPSSAYSIDSAKIIDENNITLYSNGAYSQSAWQTFPYEIDCTRGAENSSFDGDFLSIYKGIKFPIDKQISIKGKGKEIINDIRVTLNGIQICFGPQDSKDASFYADYTDTPSFGISYDKTAGDFLLRFQDTKITNALSNTSSLLNGNTFIKSLDLKEVGGSAIIMLRLNETAKYYIGKKTHIDDIIGGEGSNSPYLDIQFMSSIDNLY